MSTLLGVDVGGTFTDFLLWEGGAFRVHKRPSTPDNPGRAILEGFDYLVADAQQMPSVLVHGTTVATNAVLQRMGARTALITTEGFRDILTIGRQTRAHIYDLEPESPEPLVAPDLLFECAGRLRPDGSVEVEWSVEQAHALLQAAEEAGAEAIAVSLLFAYTNPAIEQTFRDAGTSLFLSLSSEVSPEYREVERTATTTLNAYVGPMMTRYLDALGEGVRERGIGTLHIVQSDGGAADVGRAARLPVSTLLSGPAAGVHGAFEVARQAGFDRVITFDMGGTSTDVALCDGFVPTRGDVVVGDFPARTPVVDVHTVGAGGGSIARIDAGGALRVGPESAGADPGPACYGRGDGFTVTDAQALLGRLGAHGLLAGTMALDIERARTASATLRAAGETPEAVSEATLRVAIANMERALRVVSVQRGYDPREFTLVPFGGAGPLHACALADALEMPSILVPALPGVLAALGAVQSDLTATRTQSILVPLDEEHSSLVETALREVTAETRSALADTRAEDSYALDLRYAGQSYELTITIEDPAALASAGASFHQAHELRFAHCDPSAPIEVVNVRATARVRSETPIPVPTAGAGATVRERVATIIGGRDSEADVYHREDFAPGDQVVGPAIIVQMDTTTLVEQGWHATADAHGNLVMERSS